MQKCFWADLNVFLYSIWLSKIFYSDAFGYVGVVLKPVTHQYDEYILTSPAEEDIYFKQVPK